MFSVFQQDPKANREFSSKNNNHFHIRTRQKSETMEQTCFRFQRKIWCYFEVRLVVQSEEDDGSGLESSDTRRRPEVEEDR